MSIKRPRELGDAMLVAAGVLTLILFAALYFMLPETTVTLQDAAPGPDQQTIGQER